MLYGTPGDAIQHSSRVAAAHELRRAIENDKAAQVVAGRANDLDDCRELLAMLGLEPHAVVAGPTTAMHGPGFEAVDRAPVARHL